MYYTFIVQVGYQVLWSCQHFLRPEISGADN
jgi:hypothetical protein